MSYEAIELGTLQVSGKWATITGRARVAADREERNFALIVDGVDPGLNDGRASVTAWLEGRNVWTEAAPAGAVRVR